MKRIILATIILFAASTIASAQYLGQSNNNAFGGGYGTGSNSNSHSVEGYTRNNGTYVAPHYQTNPNSTQYDNYGTRGNFNPHNGQYGTRAPRY